MYFSLFIGLVLTVTGWLLVSILPTPSSRGPLYKFFPIMMMILGVIVLLATVGVLTWRLS